MKKFLFPILTLTLLLSGCETAADPCAGIFLPLPTATRPSDPDLWQPPAPPLPTGESGGCPTPALTPTAAVTATAVGWTAGRGVNLSLDLPDQRLLAVAVGDERQAVAWESEGQIWLALGRGGDHFQVRPVTSGSEAALSFSDANRLHLVVEDAGQIRYLAVDDGRHPATPDFVSEVGAGSDPQLALDHNGWAHLFFEREGQMWHAIHQYGFFWQITSLGEGFRPLVQPHPRDGSDYLLSYLSSDNRLHIRRYGVTPLGVPGWLLVSSLSLSTLPEGKVQLDAIKGLDGSEVVAAAWVTRQPAVVNDPLPSPYRRPAYDAANPFFPQQVANPFDIFSGLNAARWYTEGPPFAAGIYQTFQVTDPGGQITAMAWGRTVADGTTAIELRLGVDPTGGSHPDGAAVVWSAAGRPESFTPFAVTLPAAGSQATLFLQATLDTAYAPTKVAWDGVTVANGLLFNGDFEEAFEQIPTGWTAYHRDAGHTPAATGRDIYTLWASWSSDGGQSWTAPLLVTENRDASGYLTGALGPEAFPLLAETAGGELSLFYIEKSGDPLPGSGQLGYGRARVAVCELETSDCERGELVLPAFVRPLQAQAISRDPFDQRRAVLGWAGRQADPSGRDIYATELKLR